MSSMRSSFIDMPLEFSINQRQQNGATSLLSIRTHVSAAHLSMQHLLENNSKFFRKLTWFNENCWRWRSIYLHRSISRSFSFYLAIDSMLWFSRRFDFFLCFAFPLVIPHSAARIQISYLKFIFFVRIRCHLYRFHANESRIVNFVFRFRYADGKRERNSTKPTKYFDF